jgi:hypothetical protein
MKRKEEPDGMKRKEPDSVSVSFERFWEVHYEDENCQYTEEEKEFIRHLWLVIFRNLKNPL